MTPLPALITPIGSNFLKDFPGQHEENCDNIDGYAGACLTTHALGTYTPIFTAVTTNPILGVAPVLKGYYYRIFDQVFVWGEFRFGASGGNVGSGVWMMSLPFEARTLIGFNTSVNGAPVVGAGHIWDDSAAAGRQPLTVHLRNSTTMMFGIRMNSGAGQKEVTHNSPIAWTALDGLSWSARYTRL